MPRTKAWLAAAVGMIGVVGCGTKPSEPAGGPVSVTPGKPMPPNAPAASGPLKAEFTLTSDALAKEYFADEKAFEAKYSGKVVRLEGVVADANKVFTATGISLVGGKKDEKDVLGLTITATPQKVDEKTWRMSSGQKVAVTGVLKQSFSKMLNLGQATVEELEPSKILELKPEALAKEYATDADATKKKYIGDAYHREIIVTGVVEDLTKGGGFQNVIMKGDGGVNLSFTFLKEDWEQLKKGDSITAKGNLSSFDEKTKQVTINSAFLIKKN